MEGRDLYDDWRETNLNKSPKRKLTNVELDHYFIQPQTDFTHVFNLTNINRMFLNIAITFRHSYDKIIGLIKNTVSRY